MARVHLTSRALLDIAAIESYSVECWGQRVADAYIRGLDAALQRLAGKPTLLRELPGPPMRLRFYSVQQHVLVGDVIGKRIYILSVWHGSMDLASRAMELEPQLVYEAQILRARILAMR